MQIDIEKLNRKTPYPEPSDEFFKTLQDNVISKTIGEKAPVVQKEAKVFSLNFKWMAAAAVVLIGGITVFLGFNNDSEMQLAQQKPMIDSAYKIEQPIQQTSTEFLTKNNISTETKTEISNPKHLKTQSALASSETKSKISYDRYITDRQDYVVGTNKKSDLDVEKVLVAFTPEQLKDLDRNSEQDVYLDLYN